MKFTNVEDIEDIFAVARFDIYDKSGNIIDSKELDSYYVGMEEYSVIKLQKNDLNFI